MFGFGNFKTLAAVLVVSTGVASVASAKTVKPDSPPPPPPVVLVDLPLPLITFTDLTSKTDPYYEDGFKFTPTSYQAGNCSPGPTSNDPCLKEVQQTGLVTTMTTQVLNGLFSLTSFYFDLQGQGQGPNQLVLSSSKTNASTQLVFQIGQSAPGGAQLYDHYAWASGNTKTVGAVYNGLIVNNKSYLALIRSSLFTDVTFVSWTTQHAQNLRIDDINATMPPVPLPAAGWLMLAGLGGLAALRRRRRAA